MYKVTNGIFRSTLASVLISLGVYALLNTNYSYLAMILFAFGLYSICFFSLYLFTGVCGYTGVRNELICEKWNTREVLTILCVNLIVGYVVGLLFSTTATSIESAAESVVSSWSTSFGYFIKSCFCGLIMFLAVHMYKKGSVLGIFLGVPLFILCGFQHCIANVIIMGCAKTMSFPILVAIVGNWIGALLAEKLLEEADVL